MAVPLVVFYELGIIGAVIMEKQRDQANLPGDAGKKPSEAEVVLKKPDSSGPNTP